MRTPMEDLRFGGPPDFLVIAIVAAVFGFGGIALAAAGIARILFFVFLILFLVSLISGFASRHRI